MDTIEELYYGNIQPNLQKNIQSDNYSKAMNFITENEDTLLLLLEGKEKKLFNQILSAYSIVLGESDVAHFRLGFRLGAKMALDTFGDGEPLPIAE